ncbi:MAG: GEVED domain-containing protein, partial [Crocinitomicaceae bacterium]|nr:GEVED domain-containing protein [Crocinitomicaceae bacterium]
MEKKQLHNRLFSSRKFRTDQFSSSVLSRFYSKKEDLKRSIPFKIFGSLIFFLTLGLSSHAQAPYCGVSVTYATSDYTSSFTTSGAVTNVSYSATTNPPTGYSDQTAQVFNSFATQIISFSTSYVGGSQGVAIWVDWNNDLDFSDLGEKVFTQTSSGVLTGSFTVPATAAAGTYRMRFRSSWNSAPTDACGNVSWGTIIDYTLSLSAIPTCLSPTALTATGLTQNSVNLGWTEQGSATDWDIEYGVAGFTPTGVPTIAGAANPSLITNLLSNTEYDFYVRSVCSLTDSSTWTGPLELITLCDALSVT